MNRNTMWPRTKVFWDKLLISFTIHLITVLTASKLKILYHLETTQKIYFKCTYEIITHPVISETSTPMLFVKWARGFDGFILVLIV